MLARRSVFYAGGIVEVSMRGARHLAEDYHGCRSPHLQEDRKQSSPRAMCFSGNVLDVGGIVEMRQAGLSWKILTYQIPLRFAADGM